MPGFGALAFVPERTWMFASLVLAGTALCSAPAQAVELGQEDSLASVEVHAFASQGFILTLKNDYLAQGTTEGSFEFSEVGINFTKSLTETLRMGVQLFAQDLGPAGNFDAKVDWFYLDYRWQDWLGFRAGRLKIPYGFYNEIQDIDSARVPVLLPQSVYPLQTREILFAHTGAELYGFVRSEPLGGLEYRAFAGTIFLDRHELNPPSSQFEVDFHVPYVVGGRLIWETPLDGLRLGASAEAARIEATVFVPPALLPEPLVAENDSFLWVASAEYAWSDLVLTAEYTRWHADQENSNQAVQANSEQTSEKAYAMATYRVTPWLQPGAYYSLLFRNVDDREGRENIQHDVAAFVRFDINAHWLAKLEGHYMVGTAGLNNPLQIGQTDFSDAAAHWAAFFVKTTAHF
ncbi:MAG TPA: hypothetical protein VK524_06645 [Polyangiaceae bacterium]|nr:hypothetical protein [Polyangiaceae bacterium]